MIITEKQLSVILGKKKEIDEVESDTSSTATPSISSASSSAPSYDKSAYGISSSTTTNDPGSSPDAEDYPSYPETIKWESGVTRGPANQIGVTRWSDTVGSKLIRGKANPLK